MAKAPQLYLILPARVGASELIARIEPVVDRFPVACLRLPGGGDEGELGRLADLVGEFARARDIAVVIDDHVALAQRHGLDGVHLTDGTRSLRAARKALGPDAIVGAFCGGSKHEGMTAAEMGADYVAFGPAGPSALGRGEPVDPDLFVWWSEMIEVPVVAEGGLSPEVAQALPVDFLAVGPEIWGADDPVAALRGIVG